MKTKERFFYHHAKICRANADLTVTLLIDHGFSLRQTVRLPLAGIRLRDAAAGDEGTRIKATAYLGSLTYGKRLSASVEIANREPREYAVWLADDDGNHVNDLMVAAKFAEYTGEYRDEGMGAVDGCQEAKLTPKRRAAILIEELMRDWMSRVDEDLHPVITKQTTNEE